MICFNADDPKALFQRLREAVMRESSGFSLGSLPPDPGLLFSAVQQGDHVTVKRICAGNKSLVWILSHTHTHTPTHAHTHTYTHPHSRTHTHTRHTHQTIILTHTALDMYPGNRPSSASSVINCSQFFFSRQFVIAQGTSKRIHDRAMLFREGS